MFKIMQVVAMVLDKLIPPKKKGKHDFFEVKEK